MDTEADGGKETAVNRQRMEIGHRIKIISNTFEWEKNRFLNQHDLTNSQVEILMYLLKNQKKTIYQKELEKAFRLSNPTVTGILDRMEEKGMVNRRVDERDRRYRAVTLTERGRETMENLWEGFQKTEELLFGCLEAEEEAELLRLLEKVTDYVIRERWGTGEIKRGGNIC